MTLSLLATLGFLGAIVVALLPLMVRQWRTRWTVPVALFAVTVVVVVLASTLAPRQVETDGGRASCIEEPLFGISHTSSDSTPACVDTNRRYLLAAAGACVLVLGLEALTCRGLLRRNRTVPVS
ncbi:hypothetical protein [Cellulosimicrobium sp. NPDC055967]|uniref:hypothetical protein n=1 Tax=Cellulosimicrobium sp. NPDC055967 TaxID=3345670 RepID=UPI0035E01A46